MNKQQQMQGILKETVDYYREDSVNRRCTTEEGDCMYTWGNNHCAVGRFLKKEFQDETWSGNNESVFQLSDYSGNSSIDKFLVDKVHGLDIDFWTNLQDIHDTIGFWEEYHEHEDGRRKYGLTDRGKEAYVRFQDKIAEGVYDD